MAVSNIAMPMLETELATRMTVKATLPNTPRGEATGAASFGGETVGGLKRQPSRFDDRRNPCADRAPMAMPVDSSNDTSLK
jgi:hypothetical protein